mgnify:CR=1 FL=1
MEALILTEIRNQIAFLTKENLELKEKIRKLENQDN